MIWEQFLLSPRHLSLYLLPPWWRYQFKLNWPQAKCTLSISICIRDRKSSVELEISSIVFSIFNSNTNSIISSSYNGSYQSQCVSCPPCWNCPGYPSPRNNKHTQYRQGKLSVCLKQKPPSSHPLDIPNTNVAKTAPAGKYIQIKSSYPHI